ncbi:uncharacterized protein Z518_01844 [Rhinocladiella mackenziei CBS 650.93]|uniref:Uncharacterized protein n=1 Tax=Rhinocladiella mackenziei CBS 650.93 TaxID=1442369 RepID=A0A0D2IVG6_9EURO|nr:uncharacterized protein Z518_01844 [Rhinocladiella mackenziei CBS 650.93]KIX07191.1 hypothetical protein Z518_01844 [Rhinocladiella mackenziei CBS 650.93]
MCRFKLQICPYPHQDPISALIFNPNKADHWERCGRPQPWGHLSCGNLIVEHPKSRSQSETCLAHEHALATLSNAPASTKLYKPIGSTLLQRRSSTDSTIVPIDAGEIRPEGIPCLWCSTVLKMVATKSKEIQKEASKTIVHLENKMDGNAELRNIQRKIMDKETELDILRRDAWRRASTLMGGTLGE